MREALILLFVVALSACAAGPASTGSAATTVATGPTREPARVTWVPGVRVAVAGDIACPPGARVTATTCRHRATARLIRGLDPRWVFALGDLQYERGALSDFRASYDASWGSFKGRTKPVLGNHEYKTAGAKGYYAYFGRKPPGYSATNVGRWRIYLLNSNCAVIDCARERAWLAKDLTAKPRRCSAIVMHHPRYSSGLEHGSNRSIRRFWNVAYQHRVDLALAGHDHDYERFAPMDGDGNRSDRGIASFVVGTGGKSLYHKGTRAPGSRYFRADRFGVLLLSLGKGAYSWKFRTIEGWVRDTGRRSCR